MFYIGHNPAAHDPDDPNHWVGLDLGIHIAMAGKSGTGKSTLLENLALSIANEGQGEIVVDPHGPLVTNLLRKIRRKDVFEFSIHRLAPLNFFAAAEPRLAIDAGWRFIASAFNQANAPQSEDIYRFAMWALYKASPINLEKTHPVPHMGLLQRFLQDADFRKSVWSSLEPDDDTRIYFEHTYDSKEWDRDRAIKTAPLINKVNKFLSDPVMRELFATSKCIDLRDMIDRSKVILVNLSRGLWGDDASEFVGAVWGFLHQRALISRQDLLDQGIKPAESTAIWDEFGAFLKTDVKTYLQESRKYGGRVVLVTQTFLTLKEETLEFILGNVSTFVIYRVGGREAALFANEFGDDFPKTAIQWLPNYHTYIHYVKSDAPLQRPIQVKVFKEDPRGRTAVPERREAA